jgi:zinc D-Ala-D-Ala dipeptidase
MDNSRLNRRISFEYKSPSLELVAELKKHQSPVRLAQFERIKELHSYRNQAFAGTLDQMLLRESVANRLNVVLEMLPSNCDLLIFDAFRTKQTQLSLFDFFYSAIATRNPQLNADEIYSLTRQFVAHPDEVSRFEIPPHNSGGAVDLVIAVDGIPLDMGTEFDADVPESSTNYFETDFEASSGMTAERWQTVRLNRRILFNAMIVAGFVNYEPEWWHFDLGDCIWAAAHNTPWIFGSMEKDI